MTRRDLLTFVFRWKNTVLGWWIFIVALTVVLVYIMPPGYEAGSAVLVERTKSPVMSQTGFTAPDMAEAMNTEMEIVRARPVIEAVVHDLALDAASAQGADEETEKSLSASFRELLVNLGLRTQVPAREGWIEDLTKRIAATPVVDSNVLRISFSSPDPVFSMRVTNAVTDAYIAHRRSIYAAQGASDYFKQKMDEADAELDRLRAALSDFKAKHAVTALSGGRPELVREIGNNRERLALLRKERAELASRFANNHPRVVVANRNIAQAERDLKARTAELEEIEARQSTIDDIQVLIASQETVFLDYLTRYEQERARESAPENLVNVKVIEYAAVPPRPKRSRMFFIKVAILGGFLLAVLIAFLREYFDTRVSTPDAAERALGVPVVGSVGKSRALRRT